ncbi:hypothetical protein L249_2350, partial [Ophiocordyceps polyrhachis-furcata BCC 54312]
MTCSFGGPPRGVMRWMDGCRLTESIRRNRKRIADERQCITFRRARLCATMPPFLFSLSVELTRGFFERGKGMRNRWHETVSRTGLEACGRNEMCNASSKRLLVIKVLPHVVAHCTDYRSVCTDPEEECALEGEGGVEKGGGESEPGHRKSNQAKTMDTRLLARVINVN